MKASFQLLYNDYLALELAYLQDTKSLTCPIEQIGEMVNRAVSFAKQNKLEVPEWVFKAFLSTQRN